MHQEMTIEPFGPAAALVLSDAEVADLGGGKRAAVVVTIGEQSVRLRLSVMGGRNVIGLSKAARATLGVGIGDRVSAEIRLDEAPRVVEVPPQLAEILAADPAASDAFDALSYTHRKEFARWVTDAKREETRVRRLEQTVVMLREGRHL